MQADFSLNCGLGAALKVKAMVALGVGIVMAIAFVLFVRGVVLIAEDYSRADVPKGQNTVGLVITLLLACASAFEAYRFLNFFFTMRRTRHAGSK
jgi:hypothetical protein